MRPCSWCRGRGVYACENIETGYRNARDCPRCDGTGCEPRCTCGLADTPNELPPRDPYCPSHGNEPTEASEPKPAGAGAEGPLNPNPVSVVREGDRQETERKNDG